MKKQGSNPETNVLTPSQTQKLEVDRHQVCPQKETAQGCGQKRRKTETKEVKTAIVLM
jgi:hypothetical protein